MVSFAGIALKNRLVASSSPLTESPARLRCCHGAGFGAAILKSAAPYVKRGAGHGRRVVYFGADYYADASFEREILTLEEGLALYRSARALEPEMLLIPSVCLGSPDPAECVKACDCFAQAGARLLQLDLFYPGALTHDDKFYQALRDVLTTLVRELPCTIMPKLTPRFDPERSCALLASCGIEYVSLLDSIRMDLPPEYGLHAGTTSYFGGRQLPLTLRYLDAATQSGLHACAGGGVTCAVDAQCLLAHGAELVQVASYILREGFFAAEGLLPGVIARDQSILAHMPWCDTEDGATCEHCGACRKAAR